MIGDKNHPIRCSKFAALVKCRMRVHLLDLINAPDDDGGPSAQTGSIVHAGVAAYHQVKGQLTERKKAAWDAIASAANGFPQGDLNEARLFITPYMDDPRNIYAEVVHCEKELTFTLPPHPIDPTKELIHMWGHLDQIRLEKGRLRVWDYKSGKKTGWEMLHDYAVQLCGYIHGSRECGLGNVQPGGVIRGYDYRVRSAVLPSPSGVFWECPWTLADMDWILEEARLAVALMRMGEITVSPGPHCTYCEFGGLNQCIPRAKQLLELEVIDLDI